MTLHVLRHKWIFLVGLLIITIYVMGRPWRPRDEATQTSVPEGPADLEKLRRDFVAGVEAVGRNDGDDAVRHLSSIHFGSRAVEEYRLYYLAQGHQLEGDLPAARASLSRLWRRQPAMVYADDAGFNLAGLHASASGWTDAADVYKSLAWRTHVPAVAAAARWREVESRVITGDVGGVYEAARLIAIRSPRASQAPDAIRILRTLDSLADDEPLRLSPAERLERAVSLTRDGDPAHALEELIALQPDAPQSLRLPIQLNRGLVLHQLRRFEESSEVLEPLTSGYYKYAVPALYHLSKNYRTLAAAIDPTVPKTITERKRVGSVKVWVGKGKKRRLVTRPRYRNVKKTIRVIDPAKKEKKESLDRLATERLKDMLQLPLAEPVRLEVLTTLIGLAQEKKQDEYLQKLVSDVIRIDPQADPALQYFWDKAWTAYSNGELGTARDLLRFIAGTYTHVNVKRQAEYWYARTVERQGEKEEAAAIYQRLASAPYDDLYALHAESRGGKSEPPREDRTRPNGPDWPEIAEEQMPRELRLAYELTALADLRDARLEIQKNRTRANQRFADAILSDLYNSSGNPLLMYLTIRRAWPQLATVEQDSVPPYFIKMYYPVKYQDIIRKYAARHQLDPHLVMGLILQESYFNPEAKSRVGATGLMQIMPATGKELAQRQRIPFGHARLENPDVNVQLGTYHLRSLVNMFGGNVYVAIAAYNAGQGNVLKWRRAARGKPTDELLESIPFPETRNYVKRVIMLRSSYERLAG